MPLYTRQFAEAVAGAASPEQAVRRYLTLLELDLRETTLLALASWEHARIPRDLWKPASPNLFRVAAGLQEPTFGRWNGLLHALREAIVCAGTLPAEVGSPGQLVAILDWLRAPAGPEVLEALRTMAPLLYYNLPGKPSRWDAIGLSVCLRNRMAHEPGADDEWWSVMASGTGSLGSAFASLPPCLDREELIYPTPWFLQREGLWLSYSGIRGDDALYYAPGRGSLRVPLSETDLLNSFQHVIGRAELQQASFRELMKKLVPEEHKGVLIGDFLLGPPAAEGGFAVVHRGYQLSIDRKVALKVFPDGLSLSKRALLRKEAERLGAFNSPAIVQLIGFHEEVPWAAPREVSLSGEPWYSAFKKGSAFKSFLAMEWVDGEDLAAVFNRPPEDQPVDEVLIRWFETSAQALAEVHASGLTHMDVTPFNIRVTTEGQVKLMDFGIARSETERQDLMTRTRLGVGTPAYMAPEQFDDQGNRQSDVYSLCATFYELFTRRRLYDHDRAEWQEVNRRKREGVAPESPRALRREIPWEIEALLLGGLNAEPGHRPTSRQLAEDIARVRQDRPIRYRRPPLHRRAGLWYRRHRPAVRVAAPALGLLAALAILLGVFWRGAEKRSEEIGKQVGTLSEKVKSESGRADTATGRADTEERSKYVQQYIADMRLLPELWKNARLDLIRDRLRPYATGIPFDPRGFEWYYWDRLANAASPSWMAKDTIRSLDWTPDGRALLIADSKGRLLKWDWAAGEGRDIRDETSGSIAVASARKGNRLAVLSRQLVPGKIASTWVEILDSETGIKAREFRSKGFPFHAAVLSPDGEKLATADFATNLLVWDAETGKLIIDLIHNSKSRRNPTSPTILMDAHDPHEGPVHALAFSPDGTTVASGGDDGKIAVWDSRTGRCLGWLGDRRGKVASLSFSKDGTKLVSHTLPKPREEFNRVALAGEIVVWRVSSLEPIRRIALSAEFNAKGADAMLVRPGSFRVDFLAEDRLIAAGLDTVVKVWDIGTGALVKEFKGHSTTIKALRTSPDGTLVGSADEGGEVRVWKLDGPGALETIARFAAPARSIGLATAEGDRLVALHDQPGSHVSDGTVDPSSTRHLLIYDRPGGAGSKPSRAAGAYRGSALSPAGRRMASYEALKDEIVVWNTADGKVIRTFSTKPKEEEPRTDGRANPPRKGEVRCLAFRTEGATCMRSPREASGGSGSTPVPRKRSMPCRWGLHPG